MNIPPRRLLLETVPLEHGASFAYRHFQLSHFPFNWHYHPELELTLIVKGRGQRFVGDSMQPYREGDLCLLGANVPHTWQSSLERGVRVASVVAQFPADLLGPKFLERAEGRTLAKLFHSARRGLSVHGRTRHIVAKRMIEMKSEASGSLRLLRSLLELLDVLAASREMEPLSLADIEPMPDRAASRVINAVCSRITSDVKHAPTQAEAAQMARLSPQAFSRFFKRCVGRTYVDYVNALRIGSACRDLIETDLGITEIAYRAGFGTLSNFNRTFLERKVMTPRQFRNQTNRAK